MAGLTEIWLVRHTAVNVPAGTCYGRTDVPVCQTFSADAENVFQLLKRIRFNAVFTSPLTRCTLLAEACGFADAMRDNRLIESDFGAWEGCCFDKIDDPALEVWYADYLHARPTGGETFDEVRKRVGEFINELKISKLQRVLVFTHAGVMMAAGTHAGLFTEAEAHANIPPFGGIIIV